MAVSDTNFLVELKRIANYVVANKWVYLDSSNPHYWDEAVRKKGTSCANATCLALQNIGALKKNQIFWSNESGILTFLPAGSETKESCKKQLFTYFDLIKVNSTWKTFKSKAKPGDICLWLKHTSTYAGTNSSKEDVWYDFGRPSTYSNKVGSKFEKCHLVMNVDNKKCMYVLRLKEKYRTLDKPTVAYYKKYTGTSSKIDEVFKAIGVPSSKYGSVAKRKPIAKANGISGYDGTASENLKLIALAKKGTLKKA